MKLIIAEDNKIEQKTIINLVETSELDLEICEVFSNGRDALDYLFDNEIDIIISDIQMPHFNGIDLLKSINEKNIRTKVIFVTCYDNPEYFIDAIDNNAASYVLKPLKKDLFHQTLLKTYNAVNESKKVLKQIKEAQEFKSFAIEKQLRELIFSSQLSDRTELLPELANKKNFLVALIGIEQYNPYFNFQSDEIYEINLITNYISEIKYKNIKLYPTIINTQSIAVTVISDTDDILVTELFNEIHKYVLTNFDICIKTGISSIDNDIFNLNELYKQSVDALAYSDIGQEKTITMYDNIESQQEFPFKLIEIVNKTEELLLSPQEEKITGLIDYYLSFSYLGNTYVQKFSYSFVHSIELNLNKYGKSIENITGIEIWKKLSSYNTESNIKKLLFNLFYAAYDLLNDNITDNNNKVVDSIKSIIAENYSDKITTEYLSRKINYSQRYLNLIFKKETGKTILQYLTEFRIQKAKELLKQKDSKIYQVSAMVGYTRNSHFNNIFKKHVGVSPYEYKEKHSE